MRCSTLQEHLSKASGRCTYVQRVASRRVKAEMVETSQQLQCRPRDIALRRVFNAYVAVGADLLPGLARYHSFSTDRTPLHGVTCPPTAPELATRPACVVDLLAQAGWRLWSHRPSMTKGAREGKFDVRRLGSRCALWPARRGCRVRLRERHIVSIHEQGLLRVGKATTYVADLGCDNAHGG